MPEGFVTIKAKIIKTGIGAIENAQAKQAGLCPYAETWGLIYMCDPSLPPIQALVAWTSDTINWAIKTETKAVMSPKMDADFDLEAARFDRVFVIMEAKQQNFYIRIKSHSACFELIGDSVLLYPVKMRFTIDGIDQVRSAISVLQVAQETTGNHAKLIKETVPYVTQIRRLKYLIAAEKSAEGVFLREIGAAIYGSKRARNEWKNLDSRAFKDEIIRAKRKGLHLMNGGYRNFLN